MPPPYGNNSLQDLLKYLDGGYNRPKGFFSGHTAFLSDGAGWAAQEFNIAVVENARDALGKLCEALAAKAAGDLSADTTSVLTALKNAQAAIIAAIPPPVVIPPALVTAVEDIATAEAFQARALNEGLGITLDSVDDTVVQQVKAALADPHSPLRELVDELLPSADDAEAIVNAADAGEWQQVLQAAPLVLQALQLASPLIAFKSIPVIMDWVKDHYPELAERIGGMGDTLGNVLMAGVEGLHGPMRAVMKGGVDLFFGAIQEKLNAIEQTTPDNVFAVAGELAAEAGALGMSAHLVAVIAEHFHPGKELGLKQLSAFLADLSNFGRIASETFGAHIAAALHSPARRRALSLYRPELPDPVSFERMLYAREISAEAVAEYYAQQGWGEDFVNAWTTAVWRRPSARELALVFEDGDVDDAWALRTLQRAGFNDEDAPILVNGVKTRALKSARQDVIGAVVANYEEGLYDDETLARVLGQLRLGTETQQLLIVGAQARRLKGEASKLRTIYESLAEGGSMMPEELGAVLSALGYDDRARQQSVARVTAKLAGKAFTEHKKDEAAALRRIQTDTVTAVKDAYRRGEITLDGLRGALIGIGLREQEASAIASIAAESLVPVPELPKVLTPAREQQQAVATEVEAVLALFHNGDITQELALSSIVSLGLDPAEATAKVALAAARLTMPKPGGGTELRTPQVKAAEAKATNDAKAAARHDATEERQTLSAEARAAEESFKAGLITADELQVTLVAVGQTADAAAAVVRRLQADAVAAAKTRQANDARAVATATRDARRDAAVLAFRNRTIDELHLAAELAAAGVPGAEASAIVARELARRKPTAAK